MTAITRARAAIDAIAGKPISAVKATRIVNAYAPDGGTNEQKASVFLASLKTSVLEQVGMHGTNTVSSQVRTLQDDARASAQQDIE